MRRISWEREQELNSIFARMWHTVFILPEDFLPGLACAVARCEAPATHRIMVNVWGSVIEHDTCDAHKAEYHGKNLDSFPARHDTPCGHFDEGQTRMRLLL